MRKGLYSLCAAFAVIFLYSCKPSGEPLPSSAGRLGTLTIVASDPVHKHMNAVCDSAFIQAGEHGAAAFVELQKPGTEQFMKFFTNQRNVLAMVTKDDLDGMEELLDVFEEDKIVSMINADKAEFIIKQDVLARNQQIVYLFGKNGRDLERKFRECRDELVKALVESELRLQNRELSGRMPENEAYYREMKSRYGIGVHMPGEFKCRANMDGTYLFQLDTVEAGNAKSIGFIIHAYPYNDSSDLSYVSIRSRRDSVCRYLVKGPVPGTYMGTSESETYTPPQLKPWHAANRTALRLKGWWTVRGVFMTGPYLRYIIPVPEKKLIFAFEGFIYNGKTDPGERDLRLVESIALNIE